jgi:uncharacterized membrane protein HdeD (DUF308 family)
MRLRRFLAAITTAEVILHGGLSVAAGVATILAGAPLIGSLLLAWVAGEFVIRLSTAWLLVRDAPRKEEP